MCQVSTFDVAVDEGDGGDDDVGWSLPFKEGSHFAALLPEC